MVPERRTTQQTVNVCRMTYETAQRQVTVMVPHVRATTGVADQARDAATKPANATARPTLVQR
jgi:hypothetical protein